MVKSIFPSETVTQQGNQRSEFLVLESETRRALSGDCVSWRGSLGLWHTIWRTILFQVGRLYSTNLWKKATFMDFWDKAIKWEVSEIQRNYFGSLFWILKKYLLCILNSIFSHRYNWTRSRHFSTFICCFHDRTFKSDIGREPGAIFNESGHYRKVKRPFRKYKYED